MGAEKHTYLLGSGGWVWLVWACECFTWSWLRYFYRFWSNCYITVRLKRFRLCLETAVRSEHQLH